MTDQKHYPMPALTEQEREELVWYLTTCVENKAMIMSIRDSLRLDRLRNQIALSALTAQKTEPLTLPPGFKPAISELHGRPIAVMQLNSEKGDWVNRERIATLLKECGVEVKSET